MKKSYKIISLILCAVMLVFTLGACGSGGSDDTAVTGGGGDISNEIEDIAAPDMTNAAKITLSGGSATVSGAPGAGGMGGMQPDGDPPEGMSMPEGFTKPDGDPPAKPSGDPPEGMSIPEGMTRPQGDPPQRPEDSGNA